MHLSTSLKINEQLAEYTKRKHSRTIVFSNENVLINATLSNEGKHPSPIDICVIFGDYHHFNYINL